MKEVELSSKKQALAALRENEERFRFFANSIPQLAWMANPDGWIFWYNDRWFEYTGTTLEQMQGWGWESVHDPVELQRMLVTWKGAIASGEPWEDTFPLRRHDGDMRWHLTRASPLRDADGNVVLWFGTNTDVEDQRRSAEALKESQKRSRQFVEQAPVAIAMFDQNMRYVAFSGQWLIDYELDGKTLTGRCQYDVMRDLPERYKDAHRRGQAGETISMDEDRYDRADGSSMWVRWVVAPWFESDGAVGGILIYTDDITSRKQNEGKRIEAEGSLRQSESRFRAAVLATSDILWTNDASGRMTGEQPGWCAFTGQTVEECQGYGWSEAVHADDAQPTIKAWEEAVRQKKTFVFEHRVRRQDGAYRVCSIRAVPILNDDGVIHEWVGVHTDITEHSRAEEALRNVALEKERLLEVERAGRVEAERIGRMKDEFLATLSHELRTPLNAILGWTEVIARGRAGAEDVKKAVAVIERNARAQAQLIEDLLDMSRIVSGKVRLTVQRIELPDVIEAAMESVRPAAEAKRIRLLKIVDPLAGPVSGDPHRLQQVIWNLLSNSVKFTPAGGKIEVLLERVNSHLEISVSDTGQGIKPEFMPHVFERFQQADGSTTRHHSGLGLGLAIVKQLVELHGGSVRVKSLGQNRGATFTVHLPQTVVQQHGDDKGDGRRHPTAPAPETYPGERADISGLKILVIDDEPDARELLHHVLSECNAKVTVAGSAKEALEMLVSMRPDVLISDIGMPETDGYELIRQVRALGTERGGDVPAVALTAFARAQDRTRAFMAGYQSHIAKPVDASELLAIIGVLTRSRGDKPAGDHQTGE